jgi:UDP-glucose 4-epimerase
MTVLVTGASGFVGAHVVDALLDAGHERVIAADLFSPPPGARSDPRIERAELDVTDLPAVRALVGLCRPRFVVHAAALTPVPEEEAANAARIVAVNAGGAANVASAALEAGGVARLILFSSTAIYNGLAVYPDPMSEETPPPAAPSSLYAVTKLACEGLAHRLAATGRLSVAAIRVTAAFGEHERPTESRSAARTSLIHRLAIATARRTPVRIGAANPGRDWVHGADVGQAIVRLLAAPRLDHLVYNVSSGEAVTFRNLIDMFLDEGLIVAEDAGAPEFAPRIEEHRPPLDITRLTTDTGFQPKVRLRDGIRALVAFHRGRAAG